MTKTFYYDSVGLSESSTEDGATITTISGINVYSDTGNTITNEDRINDQNISLPITDWANGEILQINLGSAKSADFLAVFFNVQEADDMALQAAELMGFMPSNPTKIGEMSNPTHWFNFYEWKNAMCYEIYAS